MSPVHEKPVLHGRDHLPRGADPIPDLGSGFNFDSYRDLVLAEPDLWGLWPLDDPDGSATLHNLVGGGDPLDANDPDVSYPFVYEQPGPFTTGAELSLKFQGGMGTGAGHGCWGATPGGTFADPFTVEMWAYPTATTYGYLVTFADGSDVPFAIGTGYSTNNMELWALINSVDTGATGYLLDLNAWYHIAATYDSTIVRLYANGVEVDTVADTGATAGEVRFGGLAQSNPADVSVYFNGRLSLAALYTAALDAATIAEHAGADSGESVADTGHVLTADGAGGTVWAAPTLEVNY